MTDSPSSAMIFAAGFGTRMGALTKSLPKPMLKLAGRPMIDHAVDLVRDAGISHIVSNTHYLADKIEPHLRHLGVSISAETSEILDTGGGLLHALPKLNGSPVVTLNPDAAWTGPNPVRTLCAAWRPTMNALLLLVPLTHAKTTRDTGDFSLEHGEIRRNGPFLYTGAQVIRTDLLATFTDGKFSLNTYWDHLATLGPLHGIVHDGGWCDIGHPEGLAVAEEMLTDV